MSEQATEDRDPRVNPAEGDEVRVGDVTRQVVYISVMGKVVYDLLGTPRGQLVCEMETWRRWAKGGEVLKRGERTYVERDVKLSFRYRLSGQIVGLANRCKPAKSSTPPDELMVTTLMEMAIDHALTLEGEQQLRAILKRRVRQVD